LGNGFFFTAVFGGWRIAKPAGIVVVEKICPKPCKSLSESAQRVAFLLLIIRKKEK